MTDKPFDPTKPVMQRDGGDARIICANRKSDIGYTIIALIPTIAGIENTRVLLASGQYYSHRTSGLDLINVPVKRKAWFNIQPCNNIIGFTIGGKYKTHDEANENAQPTRVACIPIEFEEGEGLE